ncbi:MAG: hypothetical protein R2877_06270 [Bdellovibrionota bacterium]
MTKGSGTKIIRVDDHVTTLTLPKSKLMVVTDGILNAIMWLPKTRSESEQHWTMILF